MLLLNNTQLELGIDHAEYMKEIGILLTCDFHGKLKILVLYKRLMEKRVQKKLLLLFW